jgi:hypothetical protein
MNNPSREERERLEKLNDTFLYNIGYEHVNNICDETDKLLEKYKDIQVPESMNEWFINFQKELEKKEKRAKIQRGALHVSKRVAMIFILISVVGSVITMSVEAFRIQFFNMVIETSQKFSSVSHQEKTEINIQQELPSEWIDFYYPTFLPNDFILTSVRELNSTKYMTFGNGLNEEIRFIQGNLTSETQIDTEDGNTIKVDINGNKGLIVKKEDVTIISWNNNRASFSIQGNVDKSTLLEIAESLEKNK